MNIIQGTSVIIDVSDSGDGKSGLSLNPESLFWSKDGSELYATAAETGRGKLFRISFTSSTSILRPKAVTSDGTVSCASPCGVSKSDNRLLITSSSFIDSCIYSILDPITGEGHTLSSVSENGSKFGLSSSQISEIWFKGADENRVHAWVMKPSTFQEGNTYPLEIFIHGGPIAYWNDNWSTRWNPAPFAERGFIVVLPNLTGSLGYGQEFVESIQNNWGGSPYIELVNCFEYMKTLPYVDIARTVALGGSFGGYMVNWIAGQPLGKEFKALVVHDGYWSIYGMYGCDETDFNVDLEGPLWDKSAKANFDRWDPAQHTYNWTTPTLVIHSDLDYNLPVSQGLAAFTILQRRGVDSMFLNFADEPHWVLKPENSLVWHRIFLDWIEKHTKLDREANALNITAEVN